MLRALSPLRYLDAQEREDLLGEMMSKNSFNAKKNLEVAGKSYEIFDISGIEGATRVRSQILRSAQALALVHR